MAVRMMACWSMVNPGMPRNLLWQPDSTAWAWPTAHFTRARGTQIGDSAGKCKVGGKASITGGNGASQHLLIRLTQVTTIGSCAPMPRPTFPSSVREFQRQFSDEAACRQYLEACRWADGFRCPRCGHAQAFPLQAWHCRECAGCHYQVSVTAGHGVPPDENAVDPVV